MNYLMVALALGILALTMTGFWVLGADRVIPGRSLFQQAASSGLEVEEEGQLPIILPEGPTAKEVRKIRFSRVLIGYHLQEVDEVLAHLAEENDRLQQQLADLQQQLTENPKTQDQEA